MALQFIVDGQWTTSESYPVVRDARGIQNNEVHVVPAAGSALQELRRQPLDAGLASDVSDEEDPGPQGADADSAVAEEADIAPVAGPDVELAFSAAPDSPPFRYVTLCGSWSGWSQHCNLTASAADAAAGRVRVLVRGVPPGLHHFKVTPQQRTRARTPFARRRLSCRLPRLFLPLLRTLLSMSCHIILPFCVVPQTLPPPCHPNSVTHSRTQTPTLPANERPFSTLAIMSLYLRQALSPLPFLSLPLSSRLLPPPPLTCLAGAGLRVGTAGTAPPAVRGLSRASAAAPPPLRPARTVRVPLWMPSTFGPARGPARMPSVRHARTRARARPVYLSSPSPPPSCQRRARVPPSASAPSSAPPAPPPRRGAIAAPAAGAVHCGRALDDERRLPEIGRAHV